MPGEYTFMSLGSSNSDMIPPTAPTKAPGTGTISLLEAVENCVLSPCHLERQIHPHGGSFAVGHQGAGS